MRAMIIALVLAGLNVAAQASSEVDFIEAYHACDEAATDRGFTKAGLPGEISGSVNHQVSGRWQGRDLIVMAVDTSTGTVFCMTTLGYRVVHYKFNGIPVIFED